MWGKKNLQCASFQNVYTFSCPEFCSEAIFSHKYDLWTIKLIVLLTITEST